MQGIAAELVIIDPPVSLDAITDKLFDMLETDTEWLRESSAFLLHSHDLDCDQHLNCAACCPSSSHRKVYRELSHTNNRYSNPN